MRMSDSNSDLWALVLAAGDGRRLRGLTTTRGGLAIPKQFCSLDRGPSLLREAISRAARVAAPERLCAIVSAQHSRWWTAQLDGLKRRNIIVQPENRGTAIGILLPLLTLLERDPRARVVILPSDHYVRDEARLTHALRSAAAASEAAGIVLLGLEPRAADPQLGYIVPRRESAAAYHPVERFVEKPDIALARALLDEGALWNLFIIAADASALLELYERRCPEIVRGMRAAIRAARAEETGGSGETGGTGEALTRLYATLPDVDFSRAILQGQEHLLRVLPVADFGWSDLGTPERVAEALNALASAQRDGARAPAAGVLLSLAAQSAWRDRGQVAAAGGGYSCDGRDAAA